jgi:diguanylate cyclase (GGDEF)-like protein
LDDARTRFPPKHQKLAAERLIDVALVAALGLLALGFFMLVQTRRDTWKQAEMASTNLTKALSADIARNLALLDLSIVGAIEALQTPGLELATPGVRKHALFDRSASAEGLQALAIFDAAGNMRETSSEHTPAKLNIATQRHFTVHQSDPNAGLFVSVPFKMQTVKGDWAIALSRRLTDSEGRFAGIVSASLNIDFFHHLFKKLHVGANGSIAFVRDDGELIARYPMRENDLGRNFSQGQNFQPIMDNMNGLVVARAQVDGIDRLYSVARIGSLPLVISVNRSIDDIYADWRLRALIIGSVLLILSASVIGCCSLFRRELRHRQSLEQELRRSAERLAVVAATDSLTGLASRRALDIGYLVQWRRASRGEQSLGVLLLDIDHFKQFNDLYGHVAGDDVLRSVADCMKSQVLRPGDLIGRYGGEEFMVVLPNTDQQGAMNVAERIRMAIAGMKIPHAASAFGHVSASVGVAVTRPTLGLQSKDLVSAADKALYDAKNAGRDCVKVAQPDSTDDNIAA